MPNRQVDIEVKIKVPFEAYKTKKLDSKATSQIKQYIRDVLRTNLSYIPLSVEQDEYGPIADCSKQTTISVK